MSAKRTAGLGKMAKRRKQQSSYQPPCVLAVTAEWDLPGKMRRLALSHPRGRDLIERADAAEAAYLGFFREPQTVGVDEFKCFVSRAAALWAFVSDDEMGDVESYDWEAVRLAALLQALPSMAGPVQ